MNNPRGGTAWPAVAALARAELRRRWRALLAIGLAVGLLGGLVTGALVAARRSGTAYDRLVAASAIDDARALVFGEDLADGVAHLPGVEAAWTASLAVARLDGPGVTYTGWLVGPPKPPHLYEPVIVAGREADPGDPTEVVALQRYAEEAGIDLGDEVTYTFLTPEEVTQFDTGFGDPDGPTVTVRVVGLARVPGGSNQSPIIATPAFNDRYGPEVAAGTFVALRLADGPAGVPALRRAADELTAETGGQTPGAEEFALVQIDTPTADRPVIASTARVLVGGLLVFAVVGLAVGLLAAGQALARHHASGAGPQQVEAALGLTRRERVLARVAALAVAAGVAGTLALAGGLAAGAIEPLGALGRFEPHPGWAPNVTFAVAGAALTAATVLLLGAATAARAGRPAGATAGGPRRLTWPRLTDIPLRPAAALGVGLAVAHPRAARSAPTRSALVGAVVSVAGVVATLGFAAALDRLVGDPARWGWHGDIVVVDTNPEIVDSLLDDDRVAALSVIDSAAAAIAGHEYQAHVVTDRRGSAGWTMLDGRGPEAADEVVLGTRVARQLDAGVGDEVDGLRVVGIGIGPSLVGEPLGGSVELTREGLDAYGRSAPFTESMLRAVPGSAPDLIADLSADYEVQVRTPPSEVANLRELGNLPEALGGFLAVIGVAAIVHALAGTVRRRWRDLAVLRALGFSPGQTGRAVATMGVVTAAIGLALGVPLGLALARLVWWLVTNGTGVRTDVAVPVEAVAIVAVVAPLVALLAATVPVRRAAAISPAALLRDAA